MSPASRTTLPAKQRKAMETAESIGGDVPLSEVTYHCGSDAVIELLEAETEGLVEVKTYFSLTPAGQEAIGCA